MGTSSSLTRSESKDTQGTCILHQQTRGIDSCRGEPDGEPKKVEVTVADKSFRLYTVVVDFWRTRGEAGVPATGPSLFWSGMTTSPYLVCLSLYIRDLLPMLQP